MSSEISFRLETVYIGSKKFNYDAKSYLYVKKNNIVLPLSIAFRDTIKQLKIPLELVAKLCLINCSNPNYKGNDKMKAYIILDSNHSSSVNLSKFIELNYKKLFTHGSRYNPRSKKLIEKEFIIELFLFENSFSNLKMVFENAEKTLKRQENGTWIYTNISKYQTRLIDFLGAHEQVITNDYFAVKKGPKKIVIESVGHMNASDACNASSSSDVVFTGSNSPPNKSKKKEDKKSPDSNKFIGPCSRRETLIPRKSPPIIQFESVSVENKENKDVQNLKKRKSTELNVSWNSPSVEPPGKLPKNNKNSPLDAIAISDDEDEDDNLPLNLLAGAGTFNHGAPLQSKPARKNVTTILVAESNEVPIFQNISNDLAREGNEVGSQLSCRVAQLLQQLADQKQKHLEAERKLVQEKECSMQLTKQNEMYEGRETILKKDLDKVIAEKKALVDEKNTIQLSFQKLQDSFQTFSKELSKKK